MNVLVFVVAIVLAIVIGTKLKTNIGAVAMAMAFVVGCLYFKLRPNDVIGCFPSNLFFYMFFGTFFYGFGMHNGTFQKVAQNILYKTGGASRFMPLIFWLVTAVVMALGAGSNAAPAFLSPIFFGVATEMGMNPLVAALGYYTAGTAFNLLPWTSDFASKTGINVATFGEETARKISLGAMAYDIGFLLIFFVVFCIITGAFKKTDKTVTFEKPEPMTKQQKNTLYVIVVVALFLVVPMVIQQFAPNPATKFIATYVDFRFLAAVGAVVLHMLGIGDINDVIRKSVPWTAIITVCGTGTLVGLAAKIGIAQTIGEWLGSSVPASIVAPVFMLVCGALSLVVSGAVVQPLMVALIPGLYTTTGCNPMVLAICMMVGLQYAGFSPFSMGGTMATLGCTDEKQKQKMIAPMVIIAILFVVITAILAALGLFDLMFAGVEYTIVMPK
ncbi:MAG: hypothetical protein MJ150_00250 [Clostridia bacterium]|nr:hypothetical protein [Clostridia bacterium]